MSSRASISCCMCARSSFASRAELEAHVGVEHVEHFPFACEICTFAHFPTRAVAIEHVRTAHNVRSFYIRERITDDAHTKEAQIRAIVANSLKNAECTTTPTAAIASASSAGTAIDGGDDRRAGISQRARQSIVQAGVTQARAGDRVQNAYARIRSAPPVPVSQEIFVVDQEQERAQNMCGRRSQVNAVNATSSLSDTQRRRIAAGSRHRSEPIKSSNNNHLNSQQTQSQRSNYGENPALIDIVPESQTITQPVLKSEIDEVATTTVLYPQAVSAVSAIEMLAIRTSAESGARANAGNDLGDAAAPAKRTWSFNCPTCAFAAERSDDYVRHLAIEHGVHRLACRVCKFVARSREALAEHLKQAHVTRRVCTMDGCKYAGVTEKAYSMHMYNHHRQFACQVCGEMISGLYNMYRHQTKYHKAKLNCPNCSRSCTNHHMLTQHIRKCKKVPSSAVKGQS